MSTIEYDYEFFNIATGETVTQHHSIDVIGNVESAEANLRFNKRISNVEVK